MKFLIDNSVSPQVAAGLRRIGHDVMHLREIGLHAAADEAVLALAVEQGRAIVSADVDFGALLAASSEGVPSLLLIRRIAGRRSARQLELIVATISEFEETLSSGAIVVIEDTRVRIWPLPIGGDPESTSLSTNRHRR